jgi:hypothetical protein
MRKVLYHIPVIISLFFFDAFYSLYIFIGEYNISWYFDLKFGVSAGFILGLLIILIEYYRFKTFQNDNYENYKVSNLPFLVFSFHYLTAIFLERGNASNIYISQLYISSLLYLITLTIGFLIYGLYIRKPMLTWKDILVDNSYRKI